MESVDVRRVSRIRDSSHENATKYVSWESWRCKIREVIAGDDNWIDWELRRVISLMLRAVSDSSPTNTAQPHLTVNFNSFSLVYFHQRDLQVEWECCHELFSSVGYSKGLRRQMTSARDVIGIYSLMCAWGITLHAHWCGCLQTWIFIVWAQHSLAFDLFRVSRSPIPEWRSPK